MSAFASGFGQRDINLFSDAEVINRVPVGPPPIAPTTTDGDPISLGLASETVATTATAYSNSNSAVFVPPNYLASFPAGTVFSARTAAVSPSTEGTATVTSVATVSFAEVDSLVITIEGVSADNSDTNAFFAVYVGISDGSAAPGVPTAETEQFAGWFALATDPLP